MSAAAAVSAARAHADLAALVKEVDQLAGSVQLLSHDSQIAAHQKVALEQVTDSLVEAGQRLHWALVKLDLIAREARS